MMNYMKSEWYRIVHGREIYLFTAIVCAIAVAANFLEFAMTFTDPSFPYATVRFNVGILTSTLTFLFMGAGIVASLLYADDRKNGTLKNAIAQGCSREGIFVGRCLVTVAVCCISFAVVAVVFVGSAVVMLQGPAEEPIMHLIAGVGAALPSTIAVIVLALAVDFYFEKTTTAVVVWLMVVFAVPSVLNIIGLAIEPVAVFASWLPANIFGNEAIVTMSGYNLVWSEPAGLARCLAAGFGWLAVFAALGVYQARRVEL